MNIKNKNKAKVLAALYNNACVLGLGALNATPEDMSEGQAQEILDTGQTYFDYLHGRVMKVNLAGDELRTDLYNRDNGPNVAEEAINSIEA